MEVRAAKITDQAAFTQPAEHASARARDVDNVELLSGQKAKVRVDGDIDVAELGGLMDRDKVLVTIVTDAAGDIGGLLNKNEVVGDVGSYGHVSYLCGRRRASASAR